VQIARIAKIRNLNVKDLELLVEQKTKQPLLGLFGMKQVNVLELNLALDSLN
jgi:K+-transporting ATPase ATPase C chain